MSKSWIKSNNFWLSISSAEFEAVSADVSVLCILCDACSCFCIWKSHSFKLLPCPTKTCFLHPLSDPSSHYEDGTQPNNLRSCRAAPLPQVWSITNWFSYQHLQLIWWPQDAYHMYCRHKGRGRTDSISQSESNFSQWSFSKAVWGHGMDLDGSHHLTPSDTLWLHINCIPPAVVKDSCS